ncbi:MULTISPECIES: outer membrane protein transport protein [unclassified Acinetobacter]|uniref:outer membrane protein transport protein n=1 Tax=unclassified Acinetobacter TaxID=196816 RepID=UPI0018A9A0D5|nr:MULTISPECIES: outer membrane protein transport protein [unclassified Acinetobacter]MBJ9954987.1 outer membrane protein transport protein [Acinetobacter baumannii]
MRINKVLIAMMSIYLPSSALYAAALDRSGQSMSAFLQPDNYFEAGISVLDPTVEGREADTSETRRHISNMGDDYYFPSAAIKLQVTDNVSFGLLYDQPFGADAAYSGNNVFVSSPNDTVLPQARLSAIRASTIDATFKGLVSAGQADPTKGVVATALKAQNPNIDFSTTAGSLLLNSTIAAYNANPTIKAGIDAAVQNGITNRVDQGIAAANASLGKGNTKVEVDSQNLSMVFGFQPNKNFNIYGGGVYQTVKGSVSLRGQAYSLYNGYDSKIKETSGVGWLAGLAFQIPEIALKASVTYRSEIDHDTDVQESISALGALALLPGGPAAINKIQNTSGKTRITTPQSVNLDFQTGIMANTVAFANLRWVNWKDFSIRPVKFGAVSEAIGPLVGKPNGFNLVEYSDDQYTVTAGIGRKLNEQWAGNVSVGWDSGAGNPVTTLGPTEGYWNLGLGVQYSPTPSTFIAGGVKYFWLGDAKAQTGAQAGSNDYVAGFKDNNAIAYGLKMGYRF